MMTGLRKNCFKKCSQLTKIDLSFNQIPELPSSFADECSRVVKIDLSFNQISEVDLNAFKGLCELVEINLDNNKIRSIDKGVFNASPKLERISINFNLIAFVHPAAFVPLNSLISLQLTSNRVKVIHSEWFGNNKTQFSSCQINGNEVAAIDSKLFDVWLFNVCDDFSGNLNLLGNKAMSLDLKDVNKKTKDAISRQLYRSFFKFDNNLYYNTLTCP